MARLANELFVKAIAHEANRYGSAGPREAAFMIMSAMRGPDIMDNGYQDLKFDHTARIRNWVYDKNASRSVTQENIVGLWNTVVKKRDEVEQAQPGAKDENVRKRLKNAGHYLGHLRNAYQGIAWLTGWAMGDPAVPALQGTLASSALGAYGRYDGNQWTPIVKETKPVPVKCTKPHNVGDLVGCCKPTT